MGFCLTVKRLYVKYSNIRIKTKLSNYHLPLFVSEKLKAIIVSVGKESVMQAQSEMSEHYRLANFQAKVRLSNFKKSEHSIAYAAVRMPATYAAIRSVLDQFPKEDEAKTILDLGAGSGSATLAAFDRWPNLGAATLVEHNKEILDLGRNFLENSADYVQADLRSVEISQQRDVVFLAYVMGEFNQDDQLKILEKAWQASRQYLVIITPGTPRDFNELLLLRQKLIEKGGTVIAPCPHNNACPMSKDDWCHFSVRLQRTSLHRHIKQATLSFEDEKYCYLIVSKEPVLRKTNARIIKKPIQASGHTILDLCEENGLKRVTISKKQKSYYKKANKAQWGDGWGV